MKKYFSAKIKTIGTKYFSLCQQTSAISPATASRFDLTIYPQKNYSNINISKSSSLLKAEKPYLTYETVRGSVRRCTPI